MGMATQAIRKSVWFAAALSAFLAGNGPAGAAPFLSATVGTDLPNCIPSAGSSAGCSGTTAQGVTEAGLAVAAPGALRALSSLNFTAAAGSFPGASSVDSQTEFVIFDLLFTGPQSTVSGSLNLVLSGQLGAAIGPTFGSPPLLIEGSVLSSVNVSGELAKTAGGIQVFTTFGGKVQETAVVNQDGSTSTTLTSSGALQGAQSGSISDVLAVNFFNVPIGIPLELELSLDALVQAGGNLAGSSPLATAEVSAFSQFSDTFGFPTSGPVFNLPTGFTANSTDGQIINNQFVGATPVPEPGTLVLFASCLLGLGLMRRKRRGVDAPQG